MVTKWLAMLRVYMAVGQKNWKRIYKMVKDVLDDISGNGPGGTSRTLGKENA